MEYHITDDLEKLKAVLPVYLVDSLEQVGRKDDLIEVIMDLGRVPTARFTTGETILDSRELNHEDLQYVVTKIGMFDADNRAGLERTLHRISGIRNRRGEIVGLTVRIGRAVYGTIDILVNNAGVYEFRPLEAVDEKHFHRQFDINVLGTLLVTKQAVPLMNGDGASIINLSSVVSLTPPPAASVYSATKAAIDAITRSLALELGPKKIRVNSLAPGLTETEGLQSSVGEDKAFRDYAVSRTPLGRVGTVDDIASAALFLASDDSRWVTGETLVAGGGARM